MLDLNQYRGSFEWVDLMIKELKECREKLAVAKEALEFYAKDEHMKLTEGWRIAAASLSKINGEIKEVEALRNQGDEK